MAKSISLILFCLILISCAKKETEEPLETMKPFAFEANWLGNWSDDLFSGISVSAKVSKSIGNTYSGALFIDLDGTGPYIPCCGATSNNGRITFETKGDSVLNYVYTQVAPDYNGGCPGTYEGSGVINREMNRLLIAFTGDDCDGFHDNGLIVWELDDE